MSSIKEKKIRYIGLVGMPLSGKDTVGKYLSDKHDFISINMHSVISEEVKRRGVEQTRENFQKAGTELRKKEGKDYVAAMICKDRIPYIEMNITRAYEAKDKYPDFNSLRYVIMGIRNYEEVLYFRKEYKDLFKLIAVLSSEKTRFQRTLKRQRKGFDTNLSYEKFHQQDIYEISELKLGSSIALADNFIINEGSEEDLIKKVEDLWLRFNDSALKKRSL